MAKLTSTDIYGSLNVQGPQTTGSLLSTGTVTGTQLISNAPTGVVPLVVTSTTLVSNLNAQYLNGQLDSYYLDWANVTNKPDPVVTVTLSGDVTGTANATLTDLGNGTISVATTIAANSVALGTDTTGNYVATIGNNANGGMTINSSGTENAAVTIGHSNILAAASNFGDTGATRTLGFGGAFVVPYVTYDINGHILTKSNLTLTMPSNPDTHYTATNYIGATGTQTNAATTNGNTYLKLVENSTIRSSHLITGSGATSVASDANGNITISSTDDNYYPTTFTWTAGSSAGPTGSLNGSGMSAVSYAAIPSASSSASGIVTTGTQTFGGSKTFTSPTIISQGMTDGTLAAFTNPHLILGATNTVDTTGFVGMTFATSPSPNYGYSMGALRSTNGGGYFVIRNHNASATGTEVFRLDASGNLTIPGKMTVLETEVTTTSNGVIFEGSTPDDFEGLLKADYLSGDQTYILPDASGTIALTSGTVNAVANSLIIKSDSGTTEGTNMYTFNGSVAKTIDFKSGTNVTLAEAAGSITFSSPSLSEGTVSGTGNVVTDIDTSGHTITLIKGITALTSQSNDFGTVKIATDSGYTWGSANINTNQAADTVGDTLTLVNGDGINLYTNTVVGNDAIKIQHSNTSDQASLTALTGANVVSDIDLDQFGHVTSLATRALTLGDLGHTESTDFKTITVSDTDSGHTWAETGSAVADALGDTLTFVSGSGINIDVSATTDAIRILNSDKGSSQNIFKNFSDGTTTAAADSNNDTFKFRGSGVTVTVGSDDATHGDNLLISWSHPSLARTNNTSTASPAHGGTFTAIDSITSDSAGHISAINTKTVTLPADNDTLNTTGSNNSDSKLYLVGATSQASSAVTYSDSEVYTTNGTLTTKEVQVGGTSATMKYDSTSKSIKFVFA